MATVSNGVPQLEAAPKICRACGRQNRFDAVRCGGCNSDRFAPPWVRALRTVARGFSVQVNEPHEKEDVSVPTLTLFKWWPGGRVSFHIREHAQWLRVKEIVDSELLPVLGWTQAGAPDSPGAQQDEKAEVSSADAEATALSALAQLGAMESATLSGVGLEDLLRLREKTASWMTCLDSALARGLQNSLADVSESNVTAGRQLGELTAREAEAERLAAAMELRRRLSALDVMADRLRDRRNYRVVNHRTAANRMLEQSLWLFDEAWWLSDESEDLRRRLDAKAEEKDKRYARKPLDFACGVRSSRLLVAKAAPPEKELDPMDLVGLEENVAECRELESVASFEMILIGEAVSEELSKLVALRDGDTRVMTYDQLYGATKELCTRRLQNLGLAL